MLQIKTTVTEMKSDFDGHLSKLDTFKKRINEPDYAERNLANCIAKRKEMKKRKNIQELGKIKDITSTLLEYKKKVRMGQKKYFK